jgi:hypothetical protein
MVSYRNHASVQKREGFLMLKPRSIHVHSYHPSVRNYESKHKLQKKKKQIQRLIGAARHNNWIKNDGKKLELKTKEHFVICRLVTSLQLNYD